MFCFQNKMATQPTTTVNSNDDDDGLESVLGEDDEFQEAALFVQNNLSLFSRDDLLYLYARFKQVYFISFNPQSLNLIFFRSPLVILTYLDQVILVLKPKRNGKEDSHRGELNESNNEI